MKKKFVCLVIFILLLFTSSIGRSMSITADSMSYNNPFQLRTEVSASTFFQYYRFFDLSYSDFQYKNRLQPLVQLKFSGGRKSGIKIIAGLQFRKAGLEKLLNHVEYSRLNYTYLGITAGMGYKWYASPSFSVTGTTGFTSEVLSRVSEIFAARSTPRFPELLSVPQSQSAWVELSGQFDLNTAISIKLNYMLNYCFYPLNSRIIRNKPIGNGLGISLDFLLFQSRAHAN